MPDRISESEFYMWRTLFALAHADSIISNEEVRYMAEILEDVPFSDKQRSVLNADIHDAQDVEAMFSRITDAKDQARFFRYARELVWIDGTYDQNEQDVMLALISKHIKTVDVDELIGKTGLQLEEDNDAYGEGTGPDADSGARGGAFSFRQKFLQKRFKNKDKGKDKDK